MKQKWSTFIVFWLSQSVSQFGSAATGLALIVWMYGQSGSALSVSFMTFCTYLPYVLVSAFAGAFVDRHSKRAVMLAADAVAATGTAVLLLLYHTAAIEAWHIYCINGVTGMMNAFQAPASSVAVGLLVPRAQYQRASGMDSFAQSLSGIAAPMLAGAMLAFGGMETVFLFDLASFLFAAAVLVFKVRLREPAGGGRRREPDKMTGGYAFLKAHKGLLYVILSMAVINFFSRLTYENILPPMILARSGGSITAYGSLCVVMGAGGIVGGIAVSVLRAPRRSARILYAAAAFSFLAGDLTMGLGQNMAAWMFAGLAASFPIPFVMAAQRSLLYRMVPQAVQGSVFAARNAIQYATIPVAILLGGSLADFVFEPFMRSEHALAGLLGMLVGSGKGSGMAVMFLCTGCLGFLSCAAVYRSREIQGLDQ